MQQGLPENRQALFVSGAQKGTHPGGQVPVQLCSVGKDHAVVGKLTAAGDLELGQQVADVQVLFSLPRTRRR